MLNLIVLVIYALIGYINFDASQNFGGDHRVLF